MFGAINLDSNLLPPVYETLRAIDRVERLNVVVHSRGGSVNAARRLALLFNEFTDHLTFIVPYFCESAGTVMALAAREIIAGSMASFSPIDPHLTAAEGSDASGPSALSAQDIRLFRKMSQDWFGLDQDQAQARSLSILCENIFPATLTSFYRSTLELEQIGNELLSLHMPDSMRDLRSEIVRALLFDFHSHGYALTADEMRKMGLPVLRDPAIEMAAWEAVCQVRAWIGPESRRSFDDDRYDALIGTRDGVIRHRRMDNAPAGVWEAVVEERE